jgi:hypothetical protein
VGGTLYCFIARLWAGRFVARLKAGRFITRLAGGSACNSSVHIRVICCGAYPERFFATHILL